MAEALRVALADLHMGWGGQAAYLLDLARGLAAHPAGKRLYRRGIDRL